LRYSGAVAATAYAQLAAVDSSPRRVLLLGPSHHVAFSGLALPEADSFATPLGDVPLDVDALGALEQLPAVRRLPRAHAAEHALELQLPFLQLLLPHARLVPVVVGDADPADVARVIEHLWRDDTLVLVSSDLSHFLSSRDAGERDARTASQITALGASLDGDDACGCRPINGLLTFAKRHRLRATALDLRSSFDTAGGDPSRVVGYGAFAFEGQ
jgi:AmmeMemoRadiSam system protein B